MPECMFILEKQGIYFQGIYGLFNTKEEALEAGKTIISKESDDYHNFIVCECPIGILCSNNFRDSYDYENIIYNIRRKRKEIIVEDLINESK